MQYMASKSNDQHFVGQVITTASNNNNNNNNNKKMRFEMPGWIGHFFYFQIFSASWHITNFNTSKVARSYLPHVFFFSRGGCTFFCSFFEHSYWNRSILSSTCNGYLYRCILQLVEGNITCYVCRY